MEIVLKYNQINNIKYKSFPFFLHVHRRRAVIDNTDHLFALGDAILYAIQQSIPKIPETTWNEIPIIYEKAYLSYKLNNVDIRRIMYVQLYNVVHTYMFVL